MVVPAHKLLAQHFVVEGPAGIQIAPPFDIDCDHDGPHPLFQLLPQPVKEVDYHSLRSRAYALLHNPAASELFKYHFAAHQHGFPWLIPHRCLRELHETLSLSFDHFHRPDTATRLRAAFLLSVISAGMFYEPRVKARIEFKDRDIVRTIPLDVNFFAAECAKVAY